MAYKPQSRCPKCKRLHAGSGRCDQCRREQWQGIDASRGSAWKRGYDKEHVERFRTAVLAEDPLCVLCGKALATVADHWPLSRRELVEQGLDPNDPQYGRGVCVPCHNQATNRNQPGGWNRR